MNYSDRLCTFTLGFNGCKWTSSYELGYFAGILVRGPSDLSGQFVYRSDNRHFGQASRIMPKVMLVWI